MYIRESIRLGSGRLWIFLVGLLLWADITVALPESVLFGGDAAYPPLEWMEHNQARGFNVELARELARIGGRRATHRLGNWPDTVAALERGELDVVPMYYSPERAQRFLFTTPYYYSSHAIYALEDAPRLTSVEQLAGKRVAVEEASFAHQQFLASDHPPRLQLTTNTLAAIQAVAQGQADYAVLASLATERLLRDHQYPLRRMGPPFWAQGYAFAINRHKPEIAAWLQGALNTAMASGRYQELYQDWSSELEPAAAPLALLRFLGGGVAVLLGLLLLGGSWYWSLKRTVALRTQELRQALELREQAEAELLHLAHFDSQTGLCKTQRFVDQLDDFFHCSQAPIRELKEILIIKLADLDTIVRTFGFARAETIVNAFAVQLKNIEGGLAAYLGRGVFALFMDRCNATQLLDQLSQRMSQTEPGLNVQLVGGSSYWPDQGRSASKLLRHAETALAMSLARHKRWLAYEPDMEPSRLDLDIISLFIDGNVQGIYPVFQPQLNLRTGKIHSAEALVRWHHPRLGYVPPIVFIPLLENSGLIEQITAVMIDEAVRVAAKLRAANLACSISVNVAAYDLTETNLLDIITQALVRHQGRAGDLRLELTETSVAADPQRVKKMLTQLSELGVYTSVDDFGTGYSSLSYLSHFPINELKIDRSFVGDMLINPRNHSIVRSTLLMARELGLVAVAEGVEDDKTLQMLKREGCDLAQGYVIAKPLPEHQFIEFMHAHAQIGFEVTGRN
ncbi:putative bifunctional diguanylate cyclase/phosphodiesterase [Cellvibrio japonicus]|uniref:Putative sensory box protein n=1 Tax=Cellvibrio japonicus (strain Ueda107) TaxID=498211 RepID=B3PDC7_CELJU|nr:EAL domain-containing protein [Cellvibrio japonicus]ACE85708.1 putative sensory box protein [Cellvibrio japonicus Ueda107]QEI13378.1 EAL domain-containing protein [Cellvibrio japonicus]QEI16952.1 EAL domain-containing protein [Cellvibrio japonicus]QEI20530.1 EAL domain-containing protein [Cellvibrio japonicus]